MLHMLGRFAFTSFFSRRSSAGSSKGSNGFGFCFWENGPLSIFVINPSINRNLKLLRWLLARRIPAPIRAPFPSDVPQTSYGSVLAQSHALGTRRCRSPSPYPSAHLLAGGAPLRWFTVGLKHDEIHVTGARSCNQEGDHFWRQPENTDLLGPSYCGRDDSRQAIQPLLCCGP